MLMDLDTFIFIDLVVDFSLLNHVVDLRDSAEFRLSSFNLMLLLHDFLLKLFDLVSGHVVGAFVKLVADSKVLLLTGLHESISSLLL